MSTDIWWSPYFLTLLLIIKFQIMQRLSLSLSPPPKHTTHMWQCDMPSHQKETINRYHIISYKLQIDNLKPKNGVDEEKH